MNTWEYDHLTFRGRRAFAALQRRKLEEAGLSPDAVELAMTPLLSFHAGFDEEQGTIMTDPTTTTQYLAWAGNPKHPIADTLADAIAAYTARFGRVPTEALLYAAAVAQLGDVALQDEGREWVRPGMVLVR